MNNVDDSFYTVLKMRKILEKKFAFQENIVYY